jgi:transcriptional regulator with XRE-family HTH domain
VPADLPEDPWIDDELLRIGQRIRQAREHRRLTQEQVFLEVPMNRSHYQHIEAGRANPTVRTLLRIARALGVPLSDLVG